MSNPDLTRNTHLALTKAIVTRTVAKLRAADHLVSDAEFADVLWRELEIEADALPPYEGGWNPYMRRHYGGPQ